MAIASTAALVAASSDSMARIIVGPGQLASSHTSTLPGGQKPEQAVEMTASSGGALSCAAASSRPAPFRQHRRPVQTVSCILERQLLFLPAATPSQNTANSAALGL